jgi:hypothetical protein
MECRKQVRGNVTVGLLQEDKHIADNLHAHESIDTHTNLFKVIGVKNIISRV